jgi:hypothetical protein
VKTQHNTFVFVGSGHVGVSMFIIVIKLIILINLFIKMDNR